MKYDHMKKKLDLLDQELIRLLGEDAGQSNEAIAKKLMVTPATIRRRKKELRGQGVLRIVGAVNPQKLGYNLSVVVAFDIEANKLNTALQYLSSRPEVTWISTTTGRFDIIALIRLRSTDELSAFVTNAASSIEGLRNSESFICLHTEKGKYSLMFTDVGKR